MKRTAFEEWLILAAFATFTGAFVWYTKDSEKFDLAFILPLAIFIVFLSVIISVGVWKTSATKDAEGDGGIDGERSAEAPSYKSRIFAILMLMLLMGISTVGLLTSLFFFLICAMWVLGVRRWKTLLTVPVALIAVIYLAFIQILGIPLTVSPLGLY